MISNINPMDSEIQKIYIKKKKNIYILLHLEYNFTQLITDRSYSEVVNLYKSDENYSFPPV